MQARAAALLKGKDAELRSVREDATAEAAAQLRDMEAALASTHQQLDQVRACWQGPCMRGSCDSVPACRAGPAVQTYVGSLRRVP